MTNVSKQQLPNTERDRLVKEFVNFFKSSFGMQQFSELFTPAEQAMFIKRLAAIIMLDTGYSRYRVAQTLQLSQDTVARYFAQYSEGQFQTIVAQTRTKQFDHHSFWQVVETLLQAGLPPMAGPGRWQKIAPAAVRGTRRRT